MEGKGGGQVRRIHIIYFLSRLGRIEHPHLIRVHHLNRNGVYLRDVKRWLADLRGKDMPEAFSWSYKRRYKAGYVWQDLVDEDLITPISDNEYVLKGSEIIPTAPFGHCSIGENKISNLEQQPAVQDKHHQQQQSSTKEVIQRYPDPKMSTLSNISSEINEESPLFFGSERSTLTEDSVKLEDENHLERNRQNSTHEQSERLVNKKKIKNSQGRTSPFSSPSSSSGSPSTTKSKSSSSGASRMFRNLITCGAVNTNDAALVMINRAEKTCSDKFTNKQEDKAPESNDKGEKINGTSRNQQQHSARKGSDEVKGSKKKQRDFTNSRTVSAAYRPVGGPNCSACSLRRVLGLRNAHSKECSVWNTTSSNCSFRDACLAGMPLQCGKQFKPEKMHTHMKYCRGMKASAKTPPTSIEKKPCYRAMNSSKEQVPAYFLTN